MPGPKPATIELSEEVRQTLEKGAARATTGQQQAPRARLILKAAEGKNHAESAKEVRMSVDMATVWRRGWHELEPIGLDDLRVEERLEDRPRPGAPPHFPTDQICQMEQMACEPPEKTGRPIRHGTGREIAEELINRGIVDHLSRRHAARLLKKGGINRT